MFVMAPGKGKLGVVAQLLFTPPQSGAPLYSNPRCIVPSSVRIVKGGRTARSPNFDVQTCATSCYLT